MGTRSCFLVAASLAALAFTGATQESRPASRPAVDDDREMIEDFRTWARDHPEAAATLKKSMDADEDGTLDASEKKRALGLLRERRAEMKAWAQSHDNADRGTRGKSTESEVEKAKRLFDRTERADGPKVPPTQRVPPRRSLDPANRPEVDPEARSRAQAQKQRDAEAGDEAGGEAARKKVPAKGRQAAGARREQDTTGTGERKTLPPHKVR